MPLSRRASASTGGSVERPADAARSASSTSMCTTWPRACTPASVRPAQVAATECTQVAMFVTDTALPDATTFEAFAYWRQLVPTARRVITVEWSRFTTDAPAHRHGLASGKYDALMLMPRGARDEEFHTAICELL